MSGEIQSDVLEILRQESSSEQNQRFRMIWGDDFFAGKRGGRAFFREFPGRIA